MCSFMFRVILIVFITFCFSGMEGQGDLNGKLNPTLNIGLSKFGLDAFKCFIGHFI